jgi:hypothetical protein
VPRSTSAPPTDEVIDLLQGGQGVFGIAVGKVWREVEGSLASCPVSGPSTTSPPRRSGPVTSSAPAAPSAWPEARPDFPPRTACHVTRRSAGVSPPGVSRVRRWYVDRAAHTAWESPRPLLTRRRRGKLPGTSQAQGPRGQAPLELTGPPGGDRGGDRPCPHLPQEPMSTTSADCPPSPVATSAHRDRHRRRCSPVVGRSLLDDLLDAAVPDGIRAPDALDIEAADVRGRGGRRAARGRRAQPTVSPR